MWTKARYRLRAALVDLWPLLGSWKLSVVLMVSAALYYGFLAIWATSSPSHVVQNIAGLLPFWLVYGLLLVNTLVCLWRRWPALTREVAAGPVFASEPPAVVEDLPAGAARAEVAARLLARGFRPFSEGGVAVQRRWSALGTLLFHGAFFLLALGFLLTLLARQESKIWVAVGEEFAGDEGQYLHRSAPRTLTLGVPDLRFRVEEIRPEFWRDQLLFTTLRARLASLPAGTPMETRINRPLWFGWGTFLRLSGFGYAPRYELSAANGRVVSSMFVKLNVFPPGQRDSFTPERFPYRVYLEVYPDAAVKDGAVENRSLNLAAPVFDVRVWRGKLSMGRALLKPGEAFEFEGLKLSFPETRYWGEFTVVQDVGAPFLLAGFLIGLAGLLLRFRGLREEARWEPGPDGSGGTLKFWTGRRKGGEA